MPLLTGQLTLHDIRDVEQHVRDAIASVPGIVATLEPSAHDELVADLIGTVWEASLRYDHTRGWAFSNLAYRLVRFRTIDHLRRANGYTRHGTAGYRTTISLETNLTRREDPDAHDNGSETRLVDALTSRLSDPAESRAPDLTRALSNTRGRHTELLRTHRHPTPRRAA